ncbi:MAG: phosphoglucosamine mutase [Clostridia bacterium]|nr:phosphoglucosamine mutase [Clostridia bacterium]
MGKYFGTDGMRGRAISQLPPDLVFRLGMAAAHILTKDSGELRPLVLIGKDTRISGDYLEAALSAGMASSGCDVLLLGVIPTPGVAALTRLLGAEASAVISASHNPYYDNGIKFFNRDGHKLPDRIEEEIERLIDNPGELSLAEDDQLGRISVYERAAEKYATWLLEAQAPDLSGFRIVVDTANGAASFIMEPILQSLGAELFCIGNQPDGCNINDNCGSTYMAPLCEQVREKKANLGLAFDGDADRMLAVDENGALVDGDQLLAIFARDMLDKGELPVKEIVATQMSNLGLKLALEPLGITVAETKVGDRYVLERMLKGGAVVGGEQSGHLILRDYNTTGDGAVAALKLLTIMSESGKSLSELARVMRKMPQHMICPEVRDKEGWQQDAEICALIESSRQSLDGRGRIIIRASGTEPRIRIMAEGEDQRLICAIVEELAELIGRKMG